MQEMKTQIQTALTKRAQHRTVLKKRPVAKTSVKNDLVNKTKVKTEATQKVKVKAEQKTPTLKPLKHERSFTPRPPRMPSLEPGKDGRHLPHRYNGGTIYVSKCKQWSRVLARSSDRVDKTIKWHGDVKGAWKQCRKIIDDDKRHRVL